MGSLLGYRTAAVALLLTCSAAQADGDWIFAFKNSDSIETTGPTDFLVEVYLQHDPFEGPSLGKGIFWADGEEGFVDFTSGNHPEFDEFVAGITNDTDEILLPWILDTNGSGGGPFYPESWYGASFLNGAQIDRIRLSVDSVNIAPSSLGGIAAEVHYTYEFFGVIPEPATLMFLALGSFALARSKSRARARRKY